MNQIIFEQWLINLNARFRIQRRKVLIDNAPSHKWDHTLRLDNICVEFLPPNLTSHIQPMDAGIIASFKARYRALHIQHLVNAFEEQGQLEKINIRQAIDFAMGAWNGVQQETITNCWKSTGILPNVNEIEGDEIEGEEIEVNEIEVNEDITRGIRQELHKLINELPSLKDPMNVEAYLNVESEHGVQTEGVWKDDEILEIVLGDVDSGMDDDDDDDNVMKVVMEPWSSKRVLESLEQISIYWQNQGGSEVKDERAKQNYKMVLRMIQDVNLNRKENQKQSQITDYFK